MSLNERINDDDDDDDDDDEDNDDCYRHKIVRLYFDCLHLNDISCNRT